MLRLYKPIPKNDIFKLHETLGHLVLDVWCKADKGSCSRKMNNDLKSIRTYSYKKNHSFGKEILLIYFKFRDLSKPERDKIAKAFKQASQINKLCEKTITPLFLKDLNDVVKNDIKPLFKWCYEDLLDKKKVGGDKLQYYKTLNKKNSFNYCPCCGLIDFEDEALDNEVREAYDHYLPKSEFPLASVSFKNLVPLCYKCNSERKKAKNPIEKTRKAYYPFSNTPETHSINVNTTFKIELNKDKELVLEDVLLTLGGDADKTETWDWLFAIKERYSSKMTRNSKTFLRDLKSRYRNKLKDNSAATFEDLLNEEIKLFKQDVYDDWKFLKIPIMEHILRTQELLDVYRK